LLLPYFLACGAPKSESGSAGPTGSFDGGGLPSAASAVASIAFVDPPSPFDPGEPRRLTVRVAPPAAYDIRFSLIGDARDAFLDTGEETSTPEGTATVVLTAPSSPAAFTVRASIGMASADYAVSTGTGFGTLEVVPAYTGHRAVTTWVATARTGVPCKDLTDVPPPDGPELAQASVNEHPMIADVPSGTPLAVTLRAGHVMGGCVDLTGIAANQTTTVFVQVVDRPLDLGGVNMPVRLSLDPADASASAWQSVADAVTTSFVAGSSSDATSLLDAMAEVTPAAARELFHAARVLHDWDATLAAPLEAAAGPGGLRGRVRQWLRTASSPLVQSGLSGTLTSGDPSSGKARLTVSDVAGVPPDGAGIASTVDLSWTAGLDDRVLFAGSITFHPALLACTLANGPAMQTVPDADGVPSALSRLVCTAVASTLAAGTGSGTSASSGCDSACIASRCGEALASMWTRARSSDTPTTMDLTASGAARIDDTARPVGFDGTWVGTTKVGGAVVTLGGAAVGGAGEVP
jgi:hypothetical protein